MKKHKFERQNSAFGYISRMICVDCGFSFIIDACFERDLAYFKKKTNCDKIIAARMINRLLRSLEK